MSDTDKPLVFVFQALISTEITVAPKLREVTRFSPPMPPPAEPLVTVTNSIAGPFYSEQEALSAIAKVRTIEENKARVENTRLFGTNTKITTAVVTGVVQASPVDWQPVE